MGRVHRVYLRHWFEFIFVFFLRYFLLLLPRDISLFVGGWMGFFSRSFVPSRRKLVLKNLTYAFPEKGPNEIVDISLNCWRKLGMNVSDFVKQPLINRKNLFAHVRIYGEEKLMNVLKRGRGAIIFSAHVGNWEIVPVALSLLGYKMLCIVKSMENPLVENVVRKIREFHGTKIVYHKDWNPAVLEWLRGNGVVGILLDQKISERGVSVKFLFREVAVSPLGAILGRKSGADVLPLFMFRSNRKVIMKFGSPIDLSLEIKEIVKIMSQWMEFLIREKPEQWFWLHNRWNL